MHRQLLQDRMKRRRLRPELERLESKLSGLPPDVQAASIVYIDRLELAVDRSGGVRGIPS